MGSLLHPHSLFQVSGSRFHEPSTFSLCRLCSRIVTLDEFKRSTARDSPPQDLPGPLLALWYDRKGDWHGAHDVAQDIHTRLGYRIHGYLHRKEGDPGNAAYWYRRASELEFAGTLDEEWEEIARSILEAIKLGE